MFILVNKTPYSRTLPAMPMRQRLIYILPFIFLVGTIGLTWYLFFELNILEDNEKRLTGIVAILGLTLGLFQFWISEVNNNKRRQFDLKYEAYKEFRQTIDSITETLNQEMAGNNPDTHGLVSKLVNLINQFYSSMQINSDFLFKGLNDKPESIKVRETLEKILIRTDKLRKEIDDVHKNNPEPMAINLVMTIGQMNWHNETRDYLKNLHDYKYPFYKIVRNYF